MPPSTFIRTKQQLWASRTGRKFSPAGHVNEIEDNLFKPLKPETLAEFDTADGGELKPRGKSPAKMCALHSSSALAANVFDHWRGRDLTPLAKALRIPSPAIEELSFEKKLPISVVPNRKVFPRDPNIDVVLRYSRDKLTVGIESKFSEAFGKHERLKRAYLEADKLWKGLPNCCELAEKASEKGGVHGLNTPQLLKHTLGLNCRARAGKFRLVYLWYATPGAETGLHLEQLEKFEDAARSDGFLFHHMTYQELICRLHGEVGEEDLGYIDYLSDRYL